MEGWKWLLVTIWVEESGHVTFQAPGRWIGMVSRELTSCEWFMYVFVPQSLRELRDATLELARLDSAFLPFHHFRSFGLGRRFR